MPVAAQEVEFDWYFLSREYPQWVGSLYNTTFTVDVAGPAYSGQIVFDAFGNEISVNCSLLSVSSPPSLAGTGFENGAGTGWQEGSVQVAGGSTLQMELRLAQVEGVWASAVLVSGFRFVP